MRRCWVGKTSRKTYRTTIRSASRTVSYDVEQRVEAYESVRAPAGTFIAFRVFGIDTLGNENPDWISTESGTFVKRSLRRTAKHSQGAGTREMETVSSSIKQWPAGCAPLNSDVRRQIVRPVPASAACCAPPQPRYSTGRRTMSIRSVASIAAISSAMLCAPHFLRASR